MKNKIRLAWVVLILLLVIIGVLSYVRFVAYYKYDVEEVEESSSEAINTALSAIIDNFNDDKEIIDYKNENININAVLKNHYIYISYSDSVTTTYEFSYSNLNLSINIVNTEENLDRFNKIYKILIRSIQKRIGNEDGVDELINLHINDNIKLDGVEKKNMEDNTINYKIDITKKIEKGE